MEDIIKQLMKNELFKGNWMSGLLAVVRCIGQPKAFIVQVDDISN